MCDTVLTIFGLYVAEPEIFDGFATPDGIDKDMLIGNLLLECCDFETVYPNPLFMKRAIEIWSAKQAPIWEKLYNTTLFEYDPIYNYDRTEEWTEERQNTGSGNREESGTSSATANGSESSTRETSAEQRNSLLIAAYNATSTTPKEQTDGETAGNEIATFSAQNEAAQDDSREESFTNESNETFSRSMRAFGNIGVTTTQEMIASERECVQFNIYNHIINEFKNRFCILVY